MEWLSEPEKQKKRFICQRVSPLQLLFPCTCSYERGNAQTICLLSVKIYVLYKYTSYITISYIRGRRRKSVITPDVTMSPSEWVLYFSFLSFQSSSFRFLLLFLFCFSFSPSLCFCLSLSTCLCLFLFLCLCFSLCPSVCLYLCLFCLSVRLSLSKVAWKLNCFIKMTSLRGWLIKANKTCSNTGNKRKPKHNRR